MKNHLSTSKCYNLWGKVTTLSAAEQKKELSILLPAYNEALQIEKCVREVDHAVSSFSESYEIIVAEDGSTDGTEGILPGLLSSAKPLFIPISSLIGPLMTAIRPNDVVELGMEGS